MLALWTDGTDRRVKGLKLLDFDTSLGRAAAYLQQTNRLVALDSCGEGSFTPTSKFIAVRREVSQLAGTDQITVGRLHG